MERTGKGQTRESTSISWEIVCQPIKQGGQGFAHTRYEYCITDKMGGQDCGSSR